MNNFLKKSSISILIIYIVYELIGKFSISFISPYAILIVFLINVFIYRKNLTYFYEKTELYVLSFLLPFVLFEVSKIWGLVLSDGIKLLLMLFAQCDKWLHRIVKYNILPIIIFLIIKFFICLIDKQISCCQNELGKLFPSRKGFYKNLVNLLNFDNDVYSIGINARYGCGKTFIVENIKINFKNVDFIDIYSISANIDNIEKYIISEISIFLNNNGIYVDKLRVLIDSISKFSFLNIFEEKKSLTRNFEELKSGIICSNRNIIFVIDDLDRVVNPEIIYKIFNIFENIKCKNIKVIYLYDFTCLSNLIPLYNKDKKINMIETKKFITKYISQEVTLPDATLEELKTIKSKGNEYIIKLADEIDKIENRISKYNIPTNFFDLTNYAPRDFEILSEQLNSLSNETLTKYDDESIILETLIFKYYFSEEYIKIVNSKSKLETSLNFWVDNIENFDITNIVSNIRSGARLIESKRSIKKIKHIVIFLIFNPNINEYNFNSQSNPFGNRSNKFNDCILEL